MFDVLLDTEGVKGFTQSGETQRMLRLHRGWVVGRNGYTEDVKVTQRMLRLHRGHVGCERSYVRIGVYER